jgi:hypothetical protein
VAVGAVIIIVAAIVISKRRAGGTLEEAPSGTEVTGAVSPAIDEVKAPAAGATPTAAQGDVTDRETAAKRPK